MGKKWLKMEDFANIAQRLNVTLDGRLEDMRKAQLVDIWAELEATYHDKAGPSITLTNAEGARIFRELQDWSIESSRREVVETVRTVGSTEGHE